MMGLPIRTRRLGLLLLAFVLLASYACCRKTVVENHQPAMVSMPVDPVSGQPAAVAVCVHHSTKVDAEGNLVLPPNAIVVALWADGRIVWSQDGVGGGPPYQTATVDPARIQELMDRLWQLDLLSDTDAPRAHWGPDASYTTIAIADGSRRQECGSWHELFEQNPGLVASDHGIESLQGRTRSQVLANGSVEYRKFRRNWDQARRIIGEYIPSSGQALNDFQVKIGRV